MPSLIPVAIYYAATAIGLGTLVASAISLGAALAYGDRARRKANRAAQAAWEAGLRDRTTLVRSAELPRSVTYGRVQISGELVYGKSIGALQDRLLLVIALRSGHALDAVEEVFFGERSLGTLDANGYPTTGPFVTSRADVSEGENFTASGNATTTFTLAYTPVSLASVTAQYATGSSGGDNGPAYEALTIASLTGNQVTVNTVNPITSAVLAAGTAVAVQYQRAQTSATWIRCKVKLGADDQAADADAITDSGGEWTSAHRGRGVPALYLWLQYNADVFPSGVENIKCTVRGKRIYDPRKDSTNGGSGAHRAADPATWEYSRNPALIARDYLTSSLGFGCPSAEIDDVMVAAAANICDEQVLLQPDPLIWQPRYTCDTDLSTENPRDDNLQVILASMAGSAVYSQGKWRILAGAYTAPAITLDETALAGTEPISLQARVPRASLFNAVKGIYVSPENRWQPTDYPIVVNSTYETQDGGERMVTDLPLPATTDAYMAQRLAKIELERSRQALTVRAAFNFKAYRVSAGDIIGLTIARYGFANKAFRVIDREFDFGRGIVLTLREEAAGVYSWNSGEATTVDLAPNTTLPDPFAVPTMNAMTLASGGTHMMVTADGTVRPRIRVSWTALTDPQVTQGGAVEIEWRELPSGAWLREPPASGDAGQAYIAGVMEGYVYQVRARARNGVGVRSEWKYATHTVAGDTDAPDQPATFTVTELSDGTRVLSWTQTDLPLDLAGFEIRYVAGGSGTWGSMTELAKVGPGLRSLQLGTPAAGTWTFAIKAFDWSGNESASARFVNGAVLGLPGKATPGWGESLCPDPLFRDVSFWTENTYDEPGWFFEDSDGVGNAPYQMGVPRSATLWQGSFTGTEARTFWSREIPFAAVGSVLRLRARFHNYCNRDIRVVARFRDAAGATLQDSSLSASAGSEIQSKNMQLTVPSGTAFLSFYVQALGGAAFVGQCAVSEVRCDVAADTGDIVPGAVTINQQSTPADSQHTQANFTAPAALSATQIGTLSYTNSTGLSVDMRGQWSLLAMGSGGGGTAGAYPYIYCSVVKNGVEQKRYTLRTSRNGTDWAPLAGQHQLTLANGDSGSITLYAAYGYVTNGAAIGGTVDWQDTNLLLVVDRR